MPPVKSLGNSRAQYNYKFGLTGFEAALPPPGPVYSDDVFSTYLYEGTGSAQRITNGINLSGEGGLVWLKSRDSLSAPYTNLEFHCLFDNVRTGATGGSAGGGGRLRTTSSQIQQPDTYLDSYNSDGFTLTSTSSVTEAGIVNENGKDFVSWSFRKQPGFFDIQQYTGDGNTGGNTSQVIYHNLGCKPGMVMIKRIDGTGGDWAVYFKNGDNDTEVGAGVLNNNNGLTTSGLAFTSTAEYITVYDSAAFPTNVNIDGATYIMYIFAQGGADTDARKFGTNEDESIIKCGTWTASSGAATVDNLGWEPQFVFVKNITDAGFWGMFDIMRGMPVGGADRYFAANTNGTESSGTTNFIDPLPNGFKISNLGSSQTFAYMAIRRPHKPITVPTKLFAVDIDSASATIPTWDSGFPVDMAFYFDAAGGQDDQRSASRLLGAKQLITSSTVNESSDGSLVWDSNEGWGKDYDNNDWYSYMFRRAPGFFDVVAYSSVTTTTYADIPHNLGVQPELVIIKGRDTGTSWHVWSTALSKVGYLNLDGYFESDNQTLSSSMFYNTDPTATTFRVGTSGGTNQQGTNSNYIAYLFASSPGVSKIGTYSGTGGAFNVDCGFSSSARFVLIKRTDPTGQTPNNAGWRVYDTLRGIVDDGIDPYINLNDNDPQVTNNDGIDPHQNGFALTGSGNFEINADGGTYLYLAIA